MELNIAKDCPHKVEYFGLSHVGTIYSHPLPNSFLDMSSVALSKKSGSYRYPVGWLILTIVAYFLMQAPETKDIGDALAFGSAFLFSSVFGIRLAATQKLIPAGPLLVLSLCALAVFTSAYLQDRI
ncbi:hypothetical protein GIB67_033275 [Kingdonia uniflora]|uniref:Uncharacterized protein n=1 Tax=Kingdonia uniflora TaxID=39325 RepID=A0A7J7MPI9_9MAGN|nr:hypothetical protein GIB67_033275 [Kingdonia uniflora]